MPKLTSLTKETICGTLREQCVDITSEKQCAPFPKYCEIYDSVDAGVDKLS